jgi:hypothetical protein
VRDGFVWLVETNQRSAEEVAYARFFVLAVHDLQQQVGRTPGSAIVLGFAERLQLADANLSVQVPGLASGGRIQEPGDRLAGAFGNHFEHRHRRA